MNRIVDFMFNTENLLETLCYSYVVEPVVIVPPVQNYVISSPIFLLASAITVLNLSILLRPMFVSKKAVVVDKNINIPDIDELFSNLNSQESDSSSDEDDEIAI